MARVRRVWRNSFFAFLSQLIRLSTNFLLFVGIARLYGVEAFGQFTTAHTLSTVFLLLADFGFDTLVAMEIARNRPQAMQIARRYFSQKVVFAGTATLAMLGLSFVQHFSWETRALVQIFALYVFGASLNNFFFAFFKGFEEFHHETRISFWINGGLLGLLIALGIVHVPIQFIALAFVVTRLMGIFMASGIAGRLAGGNVMHMTFDRWRETWRTVAVFGGYFLFGSLFFVLDTVLLSLWRGDRDVGVYQAAFKIVGLSLVVSDIAINTMIPVLARLHADGDDQWALLGRLLNKMLSLVALPICMVLFLYPDQIITILYGGDDFREAVPILRLFALTIYVRFAVDVYGIMMTTSQRQTVRMYIVIAGTVLNLALNAYMIPRYGPWGAALVSFVTNVMVGAAYIIGSRQSFLRWTCDPLYVLSFCVSLAIAFLAWNFREVSVWLAAPVIFVLCGLITYFIGFSRDEWRRISARSRPAGSAPGTAGGA
jgi:O-antigen/teichoic acid export membrane protein